MRANMNKVSPEFLPHNDEVRRQELFNLMKSRALEYSQAIEKGDIEKADQIDRGAQDLMTELRMIDPEFELTSFEKFLKWYSEQKTFNHQDQLNHKNQ